MYHIDMYFIAHTPKIDCVILETGGFLVILECVKLFISWGTLVFTTPGPSFLLGKKTAIRRASQATMIGRRPSGHATLIPP